MKIPSAITRFVLRRANRLAVTRDPDFVVGDHASPYLLRWFVIPRNSVFNIYLHVFLRSDDDRALHDHPWPSISLSLKGEYTEQTIRAGGIHERRIRAPGDVVFRRPKHTHRIELHAGDCMTLFITGPRIREWGFHCPDAGWIPWRNFTNPDNTGEMGKGCDQ